MDFCIIIECEVVCYRIYKVGIGSTESIDCLLRVAYPVRMSVGLSNNLRQFVENLELNWVGILKLINHYQTIVRTHIVLYFFIISQET